MPLTPIDPKKRNWGDRRTWPRCFHFHCRKPRARLPDGSFLLYCVAHLSSESRLEYHHTWAREHGGNGKQQDKGERDGRSLDA